MLEISPTLSCQHSRDLEWKQFPLQAWLVWHMTYSIQSACPSKIVSILKQAQWKAYKLRFPSWEIQIQTVNDWTFVEQRYVCNEVTSSSVASHRLKANCCWLKISGLEYTWFLHNAGKPCAPWNHGRKSLISGHLPLVGVSSPLQMRRCTTGFHQCME